MSESDPAPHIATETDAARIVRHVRQRESDQKKIHALTLRVKQLESTIRTFLFADTLSATQRDELVELLAGLRRRDRRAAAAAGAFTPTEKKLIESYRRANRAGKRSITDLVKFVELARKTGRA